MSELYFAETHEWVKVKGDIATIGLSDYAQGELGDIVYVELPEVDDEFEANDSLGSVESVKTVSDYYAPVSGTVVEVNDNLEDAPESVNDDSYGDGWILKIKMTDTSEIENLMDDSAYKAYLEDLKEEEE